MISDKRGSDDFNIQKENFIHVSIRVSMLNYSEEVLYVGKDHDAAWEKIGQESPRWRYKMQTWHEGEKIMDDYVIPD